MISVRPYSRLWPNGKASGFAEWRKFSKFARECKLTEYMTIRRVKQEDDPRIAAIIRGIFDDLDMPKVHTVYDDPDTDRQYEVFHDQPLSALWVAEVDGKVMGTCGCYPTDGLPGGWCEIVKFYVDPEAQGQGIGHKLFAKAVESAQCLGYTTAYLETFPKFGEAVSMYHKLGFQDIDRQMGNSGHTAMSIFMTKSLREVKFDDDSMKWKVLSSENLYHRPHLDAYKEEVELPDGRIYDEFYHLHFAPVVCIVAETPDGKLIMERQYRHAVKEVLTEIPAGIVEKGEEPVEAAKRELKEETGYAGGEWTLLSVEYAQGGVQDNKMYSFYAKGVTPHGERHLDSTEDIAVYLIDKREVLGMLVNGEIKQAPLSPALWKYFALHTDLLK